MTNLPPILREWHGLKPPEIRMVGTLGLSISKERYSQVYWIATTNGANVIIESHPLKTWHFAADGRLIGEVDTGAWQRIVEINIDKYVVLSLK